MILDWQVQPLLALIGAFIGIQGSLCLACEIFERQQKAVNRCVWVFSSGYLVMVALIASYIFIFGVESLTRGYSPAEVWKMALIISPLGFFIQLVFFSPPFSVNSPSVFWLKWVYLQVFSGIILVGIGSVMAPQGSSPETIVIFALPTFFVIGTLNGFLPKIRRWALHLPEKRMAVIGTVLIFCSFVLVVGSSLFSLLAIPLR